tara:strand:- start:33 stop:200 length:168 start_codon:yes stop_codon:yes gene_type:complete
MKNHLASLRAKYLIFISLLAIGIGILSKKVISYPTECSPINKQEITFYLEYNQQI